MHALLSINKKTKFEVLSFTHSKYMTSVTKFKIGGFLSQA